MTNQQPPASSAGAQPPYAPRGGASGDRQIQIADSIPGAEYANVMQVGHNKDEFHMMFINLFPPSGRVTGKIITTPGHMKRIARALQENIKKYEDQYGEIKEADLPEHGEMGFGEKK